MFAGGCATAAANPQAEVLTVDLAPLIDQVAAYPSRFAVEVPHSASPVTHGEWSTVGSRSTWRYSLRIPGAVSISFHAAVAQLPDSATLTTTARGTAYVYAAKDVHRGQLWSRIGRGDTLSFELELATVDMSRLRFDITGVQAGYRTLGGGAPNHPHYDKLQLKAAATTAAATVCTENWSCHATSANAGAGQATVAIVIGNVGQCSGVLLNDAPGDGAPYVLTARHCENGNPDGGSPGAARNISVYWDALVACGSPLGQIYDPGIKVQYGATTLVEQQDAWLVRLDSLPIVDDVYYSGWDATGATFVGGFTPHHALGTSRQFVGWYGQASYNTVTAAALGVHFDSTLWATVNSIGSIGAGASGSGLFDANVRLVGIVIRGVEQSGTGGAGVCPVPSPPVPTLQNATGLSTALSGIFNSTADPNSTTGTTTIESVLDPANTGTMVLDGQTAPPHVALASTVTSLVTGLTTTLTWTSSHALSCTASGGESADGWTGALATNGSLQITNYDGGLITYTITCGNGPRNASAQVQISWALSAPVVNLFAYVSRSGYNTPFQLNWNADVRPCTASGGHAGDGWTGADPPSGTASLLETVVGDVTYVLTCGTGSRMASSQVTVRIDPPSAQVTADATTLQTGQFAQISTSSVGLPCTASGGVSGDGWAGNSTYNGMVAVTESVPGTYTYALTCGSGGQAVTAQVAVTFVNAAPSVSLTTSLATVGVNTAVQVSWDANVRPCSLSVAGPQTMPLPSAPTSPHASTFDARSALGQYTYTVACGTGTNTAQASTSVTYTGSPRLSVFPGPYLPIAGFIFLVQYQSNLAPCVFSGGTPGDGWSGSTIAPNGNVNVIEATGGTYTYSITCGTGGQMLQAHTDVTVAAAAPKVTVTADKSPQSLNLPVTLTWSSNVSPCIATGGQPGDGWTGTMASSGAQVVTESSRNLVSYGLNCGASPAQASAFVSVNWLTNLAPTLTANATTASVGQSITLTWASSDGSACSAYGGANDGWGASRAASGSFDLRESVVGTYTFWIGCGDSPPSSVVVSFTAPPPVTPPTTPPAGVQLTTSTTTVTVGTPVTLTWTTTNATTCSTGGGTSADGWIGNVSPGGGSQKVSEQSMGVFNYTVTCAGAGDSPLAGATVTVTVNAAPPVTVTASSGGGGGLGWLEIALLGALVELGRRRHPLKRS